jgi:iron complex transport system substrate-binding protein
VRNKLIWAVAGLLVLAAGLLALWRPDQRRGQPATDTPACRRIVSMAPSITETLFALGLGDRVVGVTQFCQYPPEAQRLPKVGGYHNPNLEALVALKPDLVVMLVEHEELMPALQELGLKCLVVCHQNVEGILDSISTIGAALDKQAEADKIVADIQARIDRVRRKTAGLDRPRVMFAIRQTAGSGRLEDVTVAAANGFFDKVIALCGGQNACRDLAAPFPVVSREGLQWINPQVIIDLVPPLSPTELDKRTILQDWEQVAEVEAVRSGRVYVLRDDFASIPGPRFILLVEKLARLLHPEVEWP